MEFHIPRLINQYRFDFVAHLKYAACVPKIPLGLIGQHGPLSAGTGARMNTVREH